MIPEVVAYEENGVDAKSVDYARLVPVLIEAVKEQQKVDDEQGSKLSVQQKVIGEQSSRLAEMEGRMARLEGVCWGSLRC